MDPTDQSTASRCPAEIAEIEKHKYFLSQQAGYDVGWEVAERDWETNHADQFRQSSQPKSEPTKTQPSGSLLSRLLAKARRR